MIGDDWRDRWIPHDDRPRGPVPSPFPPIFGPSPDDKSADELFKQFTPPVTREEFDQLKRDVQIMKEQLTRALEYDRKNNEPDCHVDEKIKLLKKIAELVGVDLDEVFTRK